MSTERKPPSFKIVIPSVSTRQDVQIAQSLIRSSVDQEFSSSGLRVRYKVCSLLAPKAYLQAGVICAETGDILIATDSLTRLFYGISKEESSFIVVIPPVTLTTPIFLIK